MQSTPSGSIGKNTTVCWNSSNRRPTTFPQVALLVAIALYRPALISAAPCGPANTTAAAPFVIRHPDDATELAEAVNCSGGSFSAIWMQHVEMTETIRIFGGTSLSIAGSADGASIIDGRRETQLFRVDNGSLDVTNVTMTNAAGGVIKAAGSVVIARNCTFSNNKAATGGAIYLESSRMEVFDSIFCNNSGLGGAMAVFDSTVVLSNHVTFLNNNASHGLFGGALVAVDSDVSVAGTTVFAGNYALSGGGIFMVSGSFVVDGHVAFAGNQASHSGGGLYGDALTVRIDGDGIWKANEGVAGGGMLVTESDVVATSCIFLDNEAEYGGGLYLNSSTLKVARSNFTSNRASEMGGGIGAVSSLINIDDDVIFSRNGLGDDELWGGGLCGYNTSVKICGQARFIDNEANDGAGAFLHHGSLVIDGDVLFANNSAWHSAGGLYGEKLSVEVGGAVEWRGNYATYGGGVFCYSYCNITTLGGVVFAENSAFMGGGVWISEYGTLEAFNNVEFTSNTAIHGGAGTISKSRFIVTGESLFDSNSAERNGGVFIVYYESILNMSGKSLFSNNSAPNGGAVEFSDGSRVWLSGDISMVENSASSSGGAIYAQALQRMDGLTLDGVRFVSNRAGVDGGAMTLLSTGNSESLSSVINCEFEDNEAVDAGGAIFVAGGFVWVSKSNFTGNVAGRTGGAILASGVVRVNDSGFYTNSAQVGPAISSTVPIQMKASTFVNNTLLCDDTSFLDWVHGSAYLVACDGCPAECSLCEVVHPDRVQTCETLLEHTTSDDPSGDLQSLKVDRGYWRESVTSRDILECYEAAACSGGIEHYCTEGYKGPFCAVCSEDYASGLPYTCSKCSKNRRRLTIVALVIALLVIAITVFACFGILHQLAWSSWERRLNVVVDGLLFQSKKTRAFQALKIMVVAWQIVSQFTMVATVTYPNVYERFLHFVEFVTLDLGWVFSAGCLIDTNFYDKLLIITLAPLGLFALITLSYARVLYKSSSRSGPEGMVRSKHLHVSLLFWTSFLVYSTASATLFQTFACDTLESGVSYLRVDHRQECYTPVHRFFKVYASFMIVVYPIGIPLWYSMVLYKHRNTVRGTNGEIDRDHLLFKDLWQPYRPEVFYYEVVECARRAILAGIVVFIFPNTAGQVATAFLIALVFFCSLLILNPYDDPWDSWLARIGHVVVMMSMYVALMMKVDIAGDESTSQRFFGGTLVAANLVMILAVMVEAFGMCFITVRGIDIPLPRSKVSPIVDAGARLEENEVGSAPGSFDEVLGENSVGGITFSGTKGGKL